MKTLALLMLTVVGQPPPSSLPGPEPEQLAPAEEKGRSAPVTDDSGTVFKGKVREISGGPGDRSQALLLTDDGHRFVLHAVRRDEAPELVRLSGLRIQVRALPMVGLPDHIRVLQYRILDIGNGVEPRVGHIARLGQGSQSRLVFVDENGRADLLPAGWTRKLRHHVGSKVWMTGRFQGTDFLPSRFAILRPVAKEEALP